jgi:hypothetical protein
VGVPGQSFTLSLGFTFLADADMGVWHVLDRAQLQQMLKGPNGAVAKDMLKRALKVEAQAKRNLNDNDPRRVDTGRLRASITHELRLGHTFVARVGTNVVYALYVHEGTGLYGPRHQLIVPKNKKVLRWKTRSGARTGRGGYTYSKWSRGMRPNRYLKDALKAAKTS